MLVCPKCGSTFTRSQEFCGLDGTRLVQTNQNPLLGKTLERYRIESVLGSGGMATVYLGRHIFLDQLYAVKVLHGQIATDPSLARRFQREAKALGQIRHPNVVSVVDFGRSQNGLLFMVMELLQGETLADKLKREGPFSLKTIAEITLDLASGLQAAHREGFIHRDLKPANIMLCEAPGGRQTAKLMDFGLVRVLDNADLPSNTQLTQQGHFFGTPAYMAPEQILGEDITEAADLYALGIVLYQLIEGKPPFEGDLKTLSYRQVNELPRPPRLPYEGLSELALWMLHKDPRQRPASAERVIEALARLRLTEAEITPLPPEELDEEGPRLVVDANIQEASRPPSLLVQRPKRSASWLRPLLLIGILALGAGAYFALQGLPLGLGDAASLPDAGDATPDAGGAPPQSAAPKPSESPKTTEAKPPEPKPERRPEPKVEAKPKVEAERKAAQKKKRRTRKSRRAGRKSQASSPPADSRTPNPKDPKDPQEPQLSPEAQAALTSTRTLDRR